MSLDKLLAIRSHPVDNIALTLLQKMRIKSVGFIIELKNRLALKG